MTKRPVPSTEKNPSAISSIYQILSKSYKTFPETDDPWMTNGLSNTPFRSIVSATLSTMTLTKRVVSACVPLYERVSSFKELLALDDEELRALIKPVAHYNRKTKNLKIMCEQILENHGGKIPETREELMKLQGVGRKVTDLILTFVMDKPSVAVDTHILRLLNRLGLTETSSAEQAAATITEKTPQRYKRHAHEWLIQLGMQVCVARRPKCDECILTKYCDYYAAHRTQ